jgi:hypothetical protein
MSLKRVKYLVEYSIFPYEPSIAEMLSWLGSALGDRMEQGKHVAPQGVI